MASSAIALQALKAMLPEFSEDTIEEVVEELDPTSFPSAEALLDRATSELFRRAGPAPTKKQKIAEVDVDGDAVHVAPAPKKVVRDLIAEKEEILAFIEGMAPNVDLGWLSKHYETYVLNGDKKLRAKEHIQGLLANYILEHSDYPKKAGTAPKPAAATNVNYNSFEDPIRSAEYNAICLDTLCQDFRWLTKPAVRQVLEQFKGHYYPAYQFLKKDLEYPKNGAAKPKSSSGLGLLAKERVINYVERYDPAFVMEYDYTHREEIEAAEQAEFDAQQKLLDEEAERNGNVMECGCCYIDVPLHRMVQCADGHLFCSDCIKKYLEESVYASGNTTIHCLNESGCKASFPLPQLERVVPKAKLDKIFARLADLDIKKAGLENVHQCPHCDFQIEIANPDEKLLVCQNPECRRETCLLCREPNHIPLKCEEVEKSHVTDYRKKVEEAMTASLVRQCPKCKAKFFKTEGCNKMTCSCGAHICYVCRELILAKDGYSHFCPHDRNPREFGACGQCGKCFLFLKSTEDADGKLVAQAKDDMVKQLAADDDDLAKVQVGMVEKPQKKGKKQKHQQAAAAAAAAAALPNLGVMQGVFANLQRFAFGAPPPAPVAALAVDWMGRVIGQPQPPAAPRIDDDLELAMAMQRQFNAAPPVAHAQRGRGGARGRGGFRGAARPVAPVAIPLPAPAPRVKRNHNAMAPPAAVPPRLGLPDNPIEIGTDDEVDSEDLDDDFMPGGGYHRYRDYSDDSMDDDDDEDDSDDDSDDSGYI